MVAELEATYHDPGQIVTTTLRQSKVYRSRKNLFGEKERKDESTEPSEPSSGQNPVPVVLTSDVEKVITVMTNLGISRDTIDEDNVEVALHSNYSNGDYQKAVDLLLYFREAVEGVLVPITHSKSLANPTPMYYHLAGANNYKGLTCYLDTLLYAMFARLESFEPILYKDFDADSDRENLAISLRLYVNMIRRGELITTDIAKKLLDTLASAGWNQDLTKQQDCSELFDFITEKLNMPLLTLKIDIAHAGKEVIEDDHKLINESLLHVPVPGDENDLPILLEQCLELYFSNSVQVSRQIERRRTLDSTDSYYQFKAASIHVETVELPSAVATSTIDANESQVIVRETSVSSLQRDSVDDAPPQYDTIYGMISTNSVASQSAAAAARLESISSSKKSSLAGPSTTNGSNPLWTNKNEITIPAWMFLQLLPFYSASSNPAKGSPSDSESPAAQHFAKARPVLGISLMRYSWTSEGKPKRNSRKVVIPQTIRLPTFVADDNTASGNLFGNFKLVLESTIFHRGSSVNSGHFVALTSENVDIDYDYRPGESRERSRGKQSETGVNRDFRLDEFENNRRWLFFDDLQPEGKKVQQVNFEDIFEKECPYLLFYRMVAIDEEEIHREASLSSDNLSVNSSDVSAIDLAKSLSVPSLALSRVSTLDQSHSPSLSIVSDIGSILADEGLEENDLKDYQQSTLEDSNTTGDAKAERKRSKLIPTRVLSAASASSTSLAKGILRLGRSRPPSPERSAVVTLPPTSEKESATSTVGDKHHDLLKPLPRPPPPPPPSRHRRDDSLGITRSKSLDRRPSRSPSRTILRRSFENEDRPLSHHLHQPQPQHRHQHHNRAKDKSSSSTASAAAAASFASLTSGVSSTDSGTSTTPIFKNKRANVSFRSIKHREAANQDPDSVDYRNEKCSIM